MIVSMDNVTKHYSSGDGINQLSLTIPRGQVIGLLGLNGSGKTTTFKLLSGLLRPQQGQVTLLGDPPHRRRSHVAYLGDRQGFALWMAPRDMVRFMAAFYQDFDQTMFEALRHQLEIPSKPLGEMSKGQQQKLKLAATMSRKTDLYLLDEPLSGIDLVARTGILKTLIATWNEDSSVILATHEIKDVEPFLDRALFLKSGRLVADELAEEIRSQNLSIADRFLQIMSGVIL